jgi:hypothetical protein
MKTLKKYIVVMLLVFFWIMPPLALAKDFQPLVTPQLTYLPMAMNEFKPYTLSRYMKTIDSNTLYNEGLQIFGHDRFVILNFGPPRKIGSNYGTFLFDYNTNAYINEIEAGVESFIDGYWSHAKNESNASVTIAIGTTNCGNGSSTCAPGDNVTYAHGREWGLMVNRVYSYIVTNKYNQKIFVAGAIDIEPDWNSVTNTLNWVSGYSEVATKRYYNFGTCDGCPDSGTPSCLGGGGTINNSWKLNDVFYFSFDAPLAYSIPEIYRTDFYNARQWQRVSLYGDLCHNGKQIYFKGTLTQWQACQDTEPDVCKRDQTDSTPNEGWSQLWKTINDDVRTRIDSIPWLTDITWKN